jgi:hypothetical protein
MLADETVEVLLILKAPWLEEKILQAHLSRLVIDLEVQIVNATVSGRSSPSSDVIFNGTVPDVSDPFIVVDEEESDSEEETSQYVYAVWKLPVFLARPRIRLQNPSAVFTASASLKPDRSTEQPVGEKGYLQSGRPTALNLLESFSDDSALKGIKPRLSALRVSRVSPITKDQELRQHIRAIPYVKLRIYPIIHARIRFSRPTSGPPKPAVIALLEVDFTPHFDCKVELDKLQLSIPDCSIECVNADASMELPLSCVPHDNITFVYHIIPQQLDITPQHLTRELGITVSALAQLIPGQCTPRLTMAWSISVDFATPLNPGFGPFSGSGTIQRAHRPSQLSIGGGQAVTPLKSPSVTRPDALPSLEAATARPDTAVPDLGITMSFSVPTEPIHPGDIFHWQVSIVNRSSEKAARPPRKFALVAVPKRRRHEFRAMRPLSSSSRRRGDREIADAVLDENVLHAMQKNSVMDSTELVCLSADTRVGPLPPGSCHVVELQFLALKEGIVGLEAIRVVDLSSQEHVDIRDLPTMMVQPAAA